MRREHLESAAETYSHLRGLFSVPGGTLMILAGLAVTVAANAVLLRRVLSPLEHLARRMQTVDLLRPGQRLQVDRKDEVGRVVRAFNQMLERLESERRQSGRRVLAGHFG